MNISIWKLFYCSDVVDFYTARCHKVVHFLGKRDEVVPSILLNFFSHSVITAFRMKYALGETEHKHTHPHAGSVRWHKTSKFTRSYWKEEIRRAEEIAYDRIYSSLAVACWWHYLNKVNPVHWQSLIIDLILHFCQNLHYLSRSMWTSF